MKFYKYSGSGNDFIFLNDFSLQVSVDRAHFIRWCDRRYGIGADGVVLISKSTIQDYKLSIFNSDGSEAEMCGNASRCSVHFAKEILGIDKDIYQIETMNGVYSGKVVESGEIQIKMTELFDIDSIDLSDFGRMSTLFVNTGVPHAVIEVGSLSEVKFDKIAPIIRADKRFGVSGTNVDFFEVVDKKRQSIKLRVFERGVEGETLCCGTGVMATAVCCARTFGWFGEIKVETAGGQLTAIVDESFANLFFQGRVELVFSGEIKDE